MPEVFNVLLVRPSHYDRDGYPIRWYRSVVPSNSLACMNGLTVDCAQRKILGDDVDIRITIIDEANARVDPRSLIRKIQRDGGKGILALVGVQSNQFPRSIDIARPFLDANIPVCVGGFHVSGCISMLSEMPEDLVEAQRIGISFFLGEAEERRLDDIYRDAWNGRLKPVYDYLNQLPDIASAPLPYVPVEIAKRSVAAVSSFDLGRGCPFQCSFCSIINVHGRKSRFRTADDVEALVRMNHEAGIRFIFITDDNLARNKHWEEMLDRIIELREREDIKMTLLIQVDTLCHRIPRFIEKCVRAGVVNVFIGLENINPANLMAAKKKQNHISEYREMLLAWRKHPVFLSCGYIIGFPYDTKETVLRDIEIIKEELPVDVLNLSYLTPLPGSEDHKRACEAGDWLEPDMNSYDLCHRCAHHPVMSDAEWEEAYDAAWHNYYTPEHMVTVMRRVFGSGSNKRIYSMAWLAWHYFHARSHYRFYRNENGYLPLRARTDRRPTMARENPLVFYPKNLFNMSRWIASYFTTLAWFRLQLWKIERDPDRRNYRDRALAPVADDDGDTLNLFNTTTGGSEAIAEERRIKTLVAKAQNRQAACAPAEVTSS